MYQVQHRLSVVILMMVKVALVQSCWSSSVKYVKQLATKAAAVSSYFLNIYAFIVDI